MSIGDWFGYGFLALVLFGGSIAAFGQGLKEILLTAFGRPKGLTKKQIRELQNSREAAFEVLREIRAFDRYAVNPLTQELSDKVNAVLDGKTTKQVTRGEDA